MNTTPTSFDGLFAAGVARISVPLLQRDYAQGRDDDRSRRVREDFVGALRDAVTGSASLDLDFVFGVDTDEAFIPLDGQQRLTTLFLLHWYLAARCGGVAERGWHQFTYETRESARAFCAALVAHRPALPMGLPRAWIEDQPWFLAAWRHDPTVAGMLTMLDALHARLADVDAPAAWRRLADRGDPAVSFHLLRVAEMGSPDAFYVKMNSRGKPLTDFEVFKARFEHALARVDEACAKTFAAKADGAWSDMLWPMRASGSANGGPRRPEDEVIDDEFLRYLHFAAEVSAWRRGEKFDLSREPRDVITARFAGPGASPDDRRWLFDAFDAWCAKDGVVSSTEASTGFFEAHLAFKHHIPGKVAIYAGRASNEVDLFRACCQSYGERDGGSRRFSFDRTLLLYAAIVHRTEATEDFPRRLRALRNLIEASEDLLTLDEMPALARDVTAFVRSGDLAKVARLNRRQVDEERAKADLRASNPALAPVLDALEDHPLLRGILAAFDLDASRIEARARTFASLFADSSLREKLSGALLASGDYARSSPDGSRFRLVPWRDDGEWRALLRRPDLRGTLMTLLDSAARAAGTASDQLDAVILGFLTAREGESRFDWRYHLVKHPVMRSGKQGWFDRRGATHRYLLYMLEGVRMSGWFYDPYLRAVREVAARAPGVTPSWVSVDPTWGQPFDRQCLRLSRSKIELRSVSDGFALRLPAGFATSEAVAGIFSAHRVVDHRLPIPQSNGADTEDRVARCAALVADLVAAGL